MPQKGSRGGILSIPKHPGDLLFIVFPIREENAEISMNDL